jgi:UDP-glucose 4-epimerase
MSSMRALVTGGAGFIGSHLVEHLLDLGATVRVADNLEMGHLGNLEAVRSGIDFHECDVTHLDHVEALCKDIDVVFHFAANASVPRSVEEPEKDFSANVISTANVLIAARDAGIRRIVLASSAGVYGQPKAEPITESTPTAPISPYGGSKLACEGLCQGYARAYGYEVVAARIFNSYGPRQPRYIIHDFYHKLREDPTRLEILGDGKQTRDFLHVSDTVRAIAHLADVPCEYGFDYYNISSGRAVSVVELAQIMIDAMALEGVELEFTGKSWVGDAPNWVPSPAKLRATGWEPRLSLEQGVAATIQWFDEHARSKG